MRKILSFILCAATLMCLCACGKDEEPAPAEPTASAEIDYDKIYEVEITPENLLDYFEFKAYRADSKLTDGENAGEITSVQMSYGFALRQGYTAANDEKHKDTLKIDFTATGVVKSGNFTVDFNTLEYTGETLTSETVPIEDSFVFWPKGDRTTTYPYGNYSDTYVIYLENFNLSSVSGKVYLKLAKPDAEAVG